MNRRAAHPQSGPQSLRKDRLRDAALIQAALRHAEPGSPRQAFILRLRKSFRKWGSLTTAMREALRVRKGR
jgi:hypothetical protein